MEHGRFAYLPFNRRPPLQLPDGARVAVWIIPNIEHFPWGKPALSMAEGLTKFDPDILNHAWRDYGGRVGVWRVAEILERQGFVATVALNSEVCTHYPEIIEEGNRLGWEWMAHGQNNATFFAGIDADVERKNIGDTVNLIKKATGQAPRGWLGPGLTETHNTLDLLAEAGITYVADWCNDELPYRVRTKSGEMHAIPYTLELGDIQEFMLRGGGGPSYEQMLVDNFDVLYEEGARMPRIMAIALHPMLIGHPFRAKYLERALAHIRKHDKVWITTGGAIIDWYRTATANAPEGKR